MENQTKKLQEIVVRLNRLEVNTILSTQEILKVENDLSILFSENFKSISIRGSYESVGKFNFFNFGIDNNASVIRETLNARLNGILPNNVIILYEDDASVILMQVGTTEPQEEKVFWIAVEDYDRFCKGEKLEYKHRIFSFTEFFEYLLTEEEKERGIISKET